MVQLRFRGHRMHGMDLTLVLNFVRSQPGLLRSEAWFPLCLPRFDPTGFVYAYANRLEEKSGLSECEQMMVFE